MTKYLSENKNKVVVAVLAFSVVVLGSYLFFSNYGIEKVGSTSVVQNVMDKDLGIIPMSGGIKKLNFEYRNNSQEPININNLYTSCMCTKAKLQIGNVQSAFAGMKGHKSGLKPINPGMTLDPGETVIVNTEFDPNFHGPDATGPITRVVILETDSVKTPQITLTFTGEVVK